jgi:hypothetical protein
VDGHTEASIMSMDKKNDNLSGNSFLLLVCSSGFVELHAPVSQFLSPLTSSPRAFISTAQERTERFSTDPVAVFEFKSFFLECHCLLVF